jgi:hypothetical protein
MTKQKLISLDEVLKEDVLICPKCGILFVKTVRKEEWCLFQGTGVYCPACETLVMKKDDSAKAGIGQIPK